LSLDLAFDDGQQAIHDVVARFCSERLPEPLPAAFPADLWHELAGLGVLALATPESDGGAAEAVAAVEALGAALFPGPLPACFFAAQLLTGSDRDALVRGDLVSVGTPPLMPWATLAGTFLALDGERVWRGAASRIEGVETLGGEPWGRVALTREEALVVRPAARSIHDLVLAAYLAAAGRRLIREAAEYARTRVQFGRAIGEFQAVAHPLADASIRLDAAGALARCAADAFDRDPDAPATAAVSGAARLSARGAALLAAHTGHQVFGAQGITLEGPVFRISRRIRQLASQPPDDLAARDALLASIGI